MILFSKRTVVGSHQPVTGMVTVLRLTVRLARRLARRTRKNINKAARRLNRGVLRPLFVRPVRRLLRPQIPIVLITGTKGKTTTTRMLARILQEAGHVVGYTSTDGIVINGEFVSNHDSSGYAGAARVLKDSSITAAVLETARGSLLDDGLYIDRCDVAAFLNVGREQVGIDGIETLEQMAKLKRKVIDAARKTVVLNADDRLCRRLISEFPTNRTTIFSLKRRCKAVKEHLNKGGVAFCLEESGEPRIVRLEGEHARTIVSIANLPSAWGGVVRHNIANAMAAAALADALGVVSEIVGAGLASFETSVEQSPGRFNVISDRPFLVIVDRAMSPPAAEALVEALRGINVEGRRICMFTSVGNRPRRHFRELVTVLARAFDHFVCYERKQYRRGRAPGEIGELLRTELLRSGVEAHSIDVALDCEGALSVLSKRPKRGDLVVVLGSFRGEDIPTLRAAFPSSCAS